MATVMDKTVFPFMSRIVECVKTELECQGVGACRYDVLITDQDQLDGCDCCDAQARVWSRTTGLNATGAPSAPNCPPPMQATIQVGISRCAITSETLPDSADLRDQAIRGYADMYAMRHAITTCKTRERYRLDSWAPIGPQGGCYGGIWTVILQIA